MKKNLFLGACILVLLCGVACGQQQYQPPQYHSLGMGFVFGEPTGIAWKYRLNTVNSIDGVIGFSPYDRFRLNLDYLWQSHPFNEQRLALHYGPGVAFGFGRTNYIVYNRNGYFLRNEDIGLGIRGVAGVNYLIKNTPLDVFFELAPVVIFTPATGSGIDVGFGGRVYF
jgi:hypothetical protein